MKKKARSNYSVYAVVEFNISINIPADSLEDAVRRAAQLKETDFAKPLGEYQDGEIEIQGVFDADVKMEHQD